METVRATLLLQPQPVVYLAFNEPLGMVWRFVASSPNRSFNCDVFQEVIKTEPSEEQRNCKIVAQGSIFGGFNCIGNAALFILYIHLYLPLWVYLCDVNGAPQVWRAARLTWSQILMTLHTK